VIISVVAAKIWYLKNVQFLLGHPVFIQYLQRIEKCDISTRKSQKFLVSGPWGFAPRPPTSDCPWTPLGAPSTDSFRAAFHRLSTSPSNSHC